MYRTHRDATIDVDLKLDPEPRGIFDAIVCAKNALEVNLELASPDDFMPALSGPGPCSTTPAVSRLQIKEISMGVVQVTVTIRNPAEPRRSWDGLFLVDTGSTDCLVPGRALREIGIEPRGHRTYELADGREETVDIAVAEVEFMGEIVGATVGFGNDDVEPILGLTALESVGIEVDPVSQRLKRRPAVRMKGRAPRRRNRQRAAA